MLNVAIIGVSHWHTAMHLPALEDAGAQIVAVADVNEEARMLVASNSNARAYPDLNLLLANERPDLVLVMGKPSEVVEDGLRLIEERIPAIIEKPIGISAADAIPLARAATTHGVFVTVPLVNRYSVLWEKLDCLTADGRAGDSLHAHFRVINGPPSRYRQLGAEWMLDPAISGGGSLRNLGIHTVDAFVRFAGGEQVRLLSAVAHQSTEIPGLEDFVTATFETESGIIGTIEAGYSLAAGAGSDTEWRVATSKVYLVDRNETLRVVSIDEGLDETIPIPSVRARYDAFALDTLRRVRDGLPPLISLDDFVTASRLIDETYDRINSALRSPLQ